MLQSSESNSGFGYIAWETKICVLFQKSYTDFIINLKDAATQKILEQIFRINFLPKIAFERNVK